MNNSNSRSCSDGTNIWYFAVYVALCLNIVEKGVTFFGSPYTLRSRHG